jgi:oligosaccharide:H+ symporter
MFEIPFLIVGCFKYITSQFEVRFSATIYLVCFCFFKQLAMIFMSVLAGNMYEYWLPGGLSGVRDNCAELYVDFCIYP